MARKVLVKHELRASSKDTAEAIDAVRLSVTIEDGPRWLEWLKSLIRMVLAKTGKSQTSPK